MREGKEEQLPLPARLLLWLRPTRLRLTVDGPRVMADRLSRQFGDELETRRLPALPG